MGFGIRNVAEALDCAANRATLVGWGALRTDQAHNFRIPLPGSLERVTDPRSLTVTLAWLSPIRPGYQSYRCVKLEAAPSEPLVSLGVNRSAEQPPDVSVKKGTVFHERFFGERAVPFIDSGHLALRVWCKDDAGGFDEAIRYGVAVTIRDQDADSGLQRNPAAFARKATASCVTGAVAHWRQRILARRIT